MKAFDPYYKWLGIPSSEQPPNHYRLLGIALFESDRQVIETAADRMMAYVVKCANGPQQALSQKILNELSAARVCLLTPAKKQSYDRALKGRLGDLGQDSNTPDESDETDETGLPFTPRTLDVDRPYSARLKSRKNQSTSILLAGITVALVTGLIVWQFLPKPISKPSPVTTRHEAKSHKPESGDAETPVANDVAAVTVATKDEIPAIIPVIADSAEIANPSEEEQMMIAAPEDPQSPDVRVVASVSPLPGNTPFVPTLPSTTGPEKPEANTRTEKKTGTTPSLKPKTGTGKKANAKGAEPANELKNLGFTSASKDGDEYVPDPDESPAGQARLVELMNRTAVANKACVAIGQQSRPLLEERQVIVAGLPQKQAAALEAQANIDPLDKRLAVLRGRPRYSNDPLTMQQDKLQEERNKWGGIFERNKNEYANGIARVDVLNNALQALFERLRKHWEELNICRQQWMEICRPQDKYSRGDYEGVRQVIDDWLKSDELWPDAYCWGALANFELGNYPKATDMVEKADQFRVEVVQSSKTWPHIEALRGLIALKAQGQRSKASTWIQKAMSHVDKDADWETHFIAGRAVAEQGQLDSKAKVYLERALKINPNCQCAAFWLGRLQTTSSEKTVKDIDTGIKTLESLWLQSGKQSWRISFALVRAYDSAERTADADGQWDTTLALAPQTEHSRLKSQRSK